MRHGNFHVITTKMNDGINCFACNFFCKQVRQSIFRNNSLPIIINDKSGIQIRVVPQHSLHMFVEEFKIRKHFFIRSKTHNRSFVIITRNYFSIFFNRSANELDHFCFILSDRLNLERRRQCIHRFCSNTVQPN